jgi:hypothetical protein
MSRSLLTLGLQNPPFETAVRRPKLELAMSWPPETHPLPPRLIDGCSMPPGSPLAARLRLAAEHALTDG